MEVYEIKHDNFECHKANELCPILLIKQTNQSLIHKYSAKTDIYFIIS